MLNIETFFNTKNVKRFFFPGKVFWGKDCRHYLPELIEPEKTIALFVDAFFAESGFIKDFEQRFAKQLVLTKKIESMPKTETVKQIAAQLGKMPGIVISVGGGSCIDTAKAVIANFIYGTFDGVGIGEHRGTPTLTGVVKPTFISLPTTAGTGADASRYYVTYDSDTRAKVYGRSWKLIADWILLDAFLVRTLPDRHLINCAFDGFVHFFEAYLCRYERSWFSEMLALDGMSRIVLSLDQIVYRRDRSDKYLGQLLYASTMAGIAISNVRTGVIHEAAGALLEHTNLTHPESLFVFLRDTYEMYHEHIKEREDRIMLGLKLEYPELEFESFESVVKWWERLYDLSGIRASIIEAIGKVAESPHELIKVIFDRVFSDKVWIEKESPFPLSEDLLHLLIGNSLRRFGVG